MNLYQRADRRLHLHPTNEFNEPMNATESILPRKMGRLMTGVLSLLLLMGLSAAPARAQQEQQQLEQLQQTYQQAVQAAKQNNTSAAYENFEQALQLARAAEQEGAAQKIQQYLVQLPRQWGNDALESENYQEALTHFEKGIEEDSTIAYMHYGKGLALINMDQEEPAMRSLRQAAEVGRATGDQNTAQLATQRIQDHYVALASQVLSAEDPTSVQADQALEYLNEMEQYAEPDARAHFYRATALYHQNQFEDAIAAARQGLELFNGSRSDAAKYHFVIGESYVALDNIEAAKEEFREAAYGDYRPRAEHYLETL